MRGKRWRSEVAPTLIRALLGRNQEVHATRQAYMRDSFAYPVGNAYVANSLTYPPIAFDLVHELLVIRILDNFKICSIDALVAIILVFREIHRT